LAGAGQPELIGKAALIASIGGQRGYADWTNPDHRLRRLLSEFIGMAGLTFVLSGGAAVLARYGGRGLQPWETVLVLSAVSALWLVVAVYFLGDISAHFNPATTLAFALRRDMDWVMAGAYWVVQFAAAVCGSLLARSFFGPAGHLAATRPQPGLSWQAAGFEAIITFGLVLMVLNMANGTQAQRAVRAVGRRGLHHGLGDYGRPVRRRLDEPRSQLRARRRYRKPEHLLGIRGRTGRRRGLRRRHGVCVARTGQGPGGERRPGDAPGPGHHMTAVPLGDNCPRRGELGRRRPPARFELPVAKHKAITQPEIGPRQSRQIPVH